MEKRLSAVEAQQNELGQRLAGLEHTVEESFVQLVGALVYHLSKTGRLDLKAFEDDLRDDFNPDLEAEDSTVVLFSSLASLVSFYRYDGLGGGRCELVYETPLAE